MKKSTKILLATTGSIFAAVLVLTTSFRACAASDDDNNSSYYSSFNAGKKIVGDGIIVSKSIPVASFDTVNVGGNFDVAIQPGKPGNVIVTSDQNIIPYINVSTTGNELNIGIQSGISPQPTQSNKATISTQTLHNITLGGKTSLHAIGINNDEMTLTVGGKSLGYIAGDIKKLHLKLGGKSELHVNLAKEDEVNLMLGGKGEVFLSGTAKKLTIISGGKATVHAKDLIANEVTINSSGDSDMTVHALKTLTVNTAGLSKIKYYGNPQINKSSVGMGTVEKASEAS